MLRIIEQFRPKNFQVKQMFRIDDELSLVPVTSLSPGQIGKIEYYFGGKEYIHIGTWPIQNARPKFIVPIKYACLDDGTECTEIVRKYYGGPTQSEPDFNMYAPAPHVQFSIGRITIGIKWRLVRKQTPKFYGVNLFNQLWEPGKT